MHNAKLLNLILVTLLVFIFGCGPSQPTTTQPATGSVAHDPIADLPDYPGATRIAYTTGDDSGHGFSKTVKAELRTSDTLDNVLDFYNMGKLSKENGWKPVSVESSSASVDHSRVTIKLSKGTSTAKIEINQEGKGNVTISLERMDG